MFRILFVDAAERGIGHIGAAKKAPDAIGNGDLRCSANNIPPRRGQSMDSGPAKLN